MFRYLGNWYKKLPKNKTPHLEIQGMVLCGTKSKCKLIDYLISNFWFTVAYIDGPETETTYIPWLMPLRSSAVVVAPNILWMVTVLTTLPTASVMVI